MALTQKPWYCEDHIGGLNIQGYTLYSAGGTVRPRACILARNKTIGMLPGFSCRDLVAVLVKYIEGGAGRRFVVCSAYLPYDSEDPSPSRNLRNSCDIARMKISNQSRGATPMHIILHGAAPTVKLEGRPWWNFLILQIWRFLIRAMSPPFLVVIGKR